MRGKLVSRGKAKRTDYLLYYKHNTSLAIIETKDNSICRLTSSPHTTALPPELSAGLKLAPRSSCRHGSARHLPARAQNLCAVDLYFIRRLRRSAPGLTLTPRMTTLMSASIRSKDAACQTALSDCPRANNGDAARPTFPTYGLLGSDSNHPTSAGIATCPSYDLPAMPARARWSTSSRAGLAECSQRLPAVP